MLSLRQRARFERELEKQQRFTEEAKADLGRRTFGGAVRRDESMASHTALNVGGCADAIIKVRDSKMLNEIMGFSVENNVPYTFLGRGSSTIFRDGGFRGIVIQLGRAFEEIEVSREEGDDAYVSVGGAATLANFTAFDRSSGTVAGCMMVYPEAFVDRLVEVRIVDRSCRELSIARKALVSDGKLRIPRSNAIVSVLLRLPRAEGKGYEAKGETRGTILRSVFRDVGGQAVASIIADAGLAGVRVGRIRVDQDDPNSFVNEGSTRARDALVLINMIKDRVREKMGITLETAVRIMGED